MFFHMFVKGAAVLALGVVCAFGQENPAEPKPVEIPTMLVAPEDVPEPEVWYPEFSGKPNSNSRSAAVPYTPPAPTFTSQYTYCVFSGCIGGNIVTRIFGSNLNTIGSAIVVFPNGTMSGAALTTDFLGKWVNFSYTYPTRYYSYPYNTGGNWKVYLFSTRGTLLAVVTYRP